MSWINRFANLFRTGKLDRDIDEEIRFHLEARLRDNLQTGMPVVEASQDAARRFGSQMRAAEGAREANLLVWVETVHQDIRYALRTLRRNRALTAVAVGSLALGIGANTAIFSLIDTLLIKQLPVRDPQELVLPAIPGAAPMGRPGTSFSYPMYEEIRDGNTSFAGVTATFGVGRNSVTTDGRRDRATVSWVSGTYFSVLGVNAILGRTFGPEEDRRFGNHPVAVIGYKYWRQRFGQDARVLGKAIISDNKIFTIVGVAPPEFFGTEVGESVDIWLPLTMVNPDFVTGPRARGFQAAQLLARLKPGLPEPAALARVNVLFSQLRRQEDERMRRSDTERRMTEEQHQAFLAQRLEFLPANRGLSRLREQFSQPLIVLMIVVGLVLMIACLNVANLLLARATVRRREIAVRLSVGAARSRIIRQLLTESMLLAAAGGLLGIAVAFWASKVLIRMVGSGPDSIGVHFQLNAEVLAFTVAVSVFTGLLFGIAPALSATRISLTPMLKESGRGVESGVGRVRLPLRKVLVGIQIALSLMLLVGAGLFIRTLQNLLNQNAGFDRSSVLLAAVRGPRTELKGPALLNEFREILRGAEALPGVRSASLSTYRLFGGMSWSDPVFIDGFSSGGECHLMGVSPGFFDTMGMRITSGRKFTDRDDERGPAVAVVNESMARHYFGEVSPLGKHFAWTPRGRQIEIVGVVKDAKWRDLRASSPPFVYFPYFQWQASPYSDPKEYPGPDVYLELRTSADAAGFSSEARQAIAARSGFQAGEIVTQAALVEKSVATERLLARLAGFFGILAIALACIGLYGLMSYTVARRTNEIGVRIAMGASRLDIVRIVLREILLLLVGGITIGVAAALVCSRFIGHFLFGLNPTDAATIASAAVVLLAVAALAGYVPARRASRTDPMVALRYE